MKTVTMYKDLKWKFMEVNTIDGIQWEPALYYKKECLMTFKPAFNFMIEMMMNKIKKDFKQYGWNKVAFDDIQDIKFKIEEAMTTVKTRDSEGIVRTTTFIKFNDNLDSFLTM